MSRIPTSPSHGERQHTLPPLLSLLDRKPGPQMSPRAGGMQCTPRSVSHPPYGYSARRKERIDWRDTGGMRRQRPDLLLRDAAPPFAPSVVIAAENIDCQASSF